MNRRVAAPGVGRLPIWSCSVRGFACHPCYHGRGALLPHLFTLTWARGPGGIFSVPLSFRLPWPGVTRRTALRSSDFPPTLRRAAVWLAAKVWLYKLVMADG